MQVTLRAVVFEQGMIRQGNIDVNHRPVIINDDGSHSTIFSFTVPINKDGSLWNGDYEKAPQYALVPSIAGGKFLTPDGKKPKESDRNALQKLEDAAANHYQKTNEHLGIFSSEQAADKYATATHSYMPNGGKQKVFVAPRTKEGQ